ncbi:MAG: AsmA-like C-terminal region-containing protein [Planctomycetota bacterium]
MSITDRPSSSTILNTAWRRSLAARPRKPLRRRIVRWIAALALLLLIGGYLFVTDAERVRRFAQDLLANTTQSDVQIGKADLGLFTGLQLQDVQMRVPGDDTPVLRARSVRLSLDWAALIGGRVAAKQIVAVEPALRLSESETTGQWNFAPLLAGGADDGPTEPTRAPDQLPAFLLRGGVVEVARRDADGNDEVIGTVSVEGQLTPEESGIYAFNIRTRGNEERGPAASGTIDLDNGEMAAQVANFTLGSDVQAVLPERVRQWWERLEVAGRIDVPTVRYRFKTPRQQNAGFEVVVELVDGTIKVPMEAWNSQRDIDARIWLAHLAGQLPGGAGDPAVSAFLPPPVMLESVTGTFRFTDSSVTIDPLIGKLEGSPVEIHGRADGYGLDSPALFTVSTPRTFRLPPEPAYISGMPRQVREAYHRFRPSGVAELELTLQRKQRGGRVRIGGDITIIDGNFAFHRLPYPIRNATGTISFGTDVHTDDDVLSVTELVGFGPVGSPNETARVSVNGQIRPLRRYAGVDFTITGENVTTTELLRSALPGPVQQTFRAFDVPDDDEIPQVTGDFNCTLLRTPGREGRWNIVTTLNIRDGVGRFQQFPYPLKKLNGFLRVERNRAILQEITTEHEGGTATIDGVIRFDALPDGSRPVRPTLSLTARNLPLDEAIEEALTDEQADALRKLNPGGRFDLDGTIGTDADHRPTFDLTAIVRDGSLNPLGGEFATRLDMASLRLRPDTIDFRGQNQILRAEGSVKFPPQRSAMLDVDVTAVGLELTDELRADLPETARLAWEWLDLMGTTDAVLDYSGPLDGEDADFKLTLDPLGLRVKPEAIPYQLENVRGRVIVMPDLVEFENVTASKPNGVALGLSGRGVTIHESDGTNRTQWELALRATDVPVEEELIVALPEALAELATELSLAGRLDVDLPDLRIVPGEEEDEPDITFSGSVGGDDLGFDIGVLVENADGEFVVTRASVAGGKLKLLDATATATSLTVSGRPAGDLSVDVDLPEDSDVLNMTNLRGQWCGGQLAGNGTLRVPEDGPQNYLLDLTLHQADVATLAGGVELGAGDEPITAQLTASLTAEGVLGDPRSRRGRGDLAIVGNRGGRLVKLPLMIGLVQVINLAFPDDNAFTDATAAYALSGDQLVLESFELSGGDVALRGNGSIDFDTRDVALIITTANRGLDRMPVLGGLIGGARDELLTIRINGKLEKPEVRAVPLNTFQTTVDEVLRGR